MTHHNLTIFDVQHGACALLKVQTDTATWYVLIDCGHKNNSRGVWFPGDHLRSLGVTYLDLLIVTNLDEDHVSGLPNLLSKVSIGRIFSNPSVAPYTIRSLKSETDMGPGIDALARELSKQTGPMEIPWVPDTNIHCSWNRYPTFDDENNLSVITFIQFAGHRFLFCGDMECNGFDQLLLKNEATRLMARDTEVLIAPHHGRQNGICPALFDRFGCKPKLVVISDDYKQYDTQETSAYYRDKAIGAKFKGNDRWVLTTRSDGNIDFMDVCGMLFAY